MHGGDKIAEVLSARGVRFLFTLCGGHISPILVGAKNKGIRVIDVRHEVNAVFAADAVARLTGVPGVAAVTAGPGVTNTITAIKNAQLAQSPVILLGGATATMLRGRGALQDIDQMALMKPHVKWQTSVRHVKDLVPVMEKAFDVAQGGVPGPVFIEVPVDLLYNEELVRSWYGAKSQADTSKMGLKDKAQNWYIQQHLERMFAGVETSQAKASAIPYAPPMPTQNEVDTAEHELHKAERPVLILGSQAVLEPGEIRELVRDMESLGIPTYLSGMARGLLGANHPLQLRHKRREALKEADLIMLAGVPCDFRLDYGRHINSGAYYISINRSAADLKRNRKPHLGVNADGGRFLQRLSDEFHPKPGQWAAWLDKLKKRDAARDAEIQAQIAEASSEVINPLRLCSDLDAQADANCMFVADGGDFVGTASYIVRPRKPLTWLDPGVFGTLGVGGGFALGAKLVNPDAEVWILYGDGSSAYSLMEFDTFVRHNVPVIAVVGNDACWSQIAREQVEVLKDDVGCALAHTDYHVVAEGFGGKGILLKKPEDVAEGLRKAKELAKAGHPVLINAHLGKTDFRKGSISM